MRTVTNTLREEDLSLIHIFPSRAEARRAVQQGGVTVEGEKVGDIKTSYTADTLGEGLVVKKGKKNFRKVVMK